MTYKVLETIRNGNEIEMETVHEYASENEMENGMQELRIHFNAQRLDATIKGRGVEFLNRTQDLKIL